MYFVAGDQFAVAAPAHIEQEAESWSVMVQVS